MSGNRAPDIDESDISNAMVLLNAMNDKALTGDVRAAEFVRDTSGQAPVTKTADTTADGEDRPVIVNDIPKETK